MHHVSFGQHGFNDSQMFYEVSTQMHVRAADDPESGNDPATAAPASGKIFRSHNRNLAETLIVVKLN